MDSQTAYTMALVAAIISGCALLVAGSSLAWNIWSWVRSGHRASFNVLLRSSDGHQIIDYAPSRYAEVQPLHGPDGFMLVAVVFRVHNVGRLPVTVQDCLLATDRGQHVALRGGTTAGSDTLPRRIEVGDLGTFIYPLSHFVKAVQGARKIQMTIIPELELATGKRLVSSGKLLDYVVYGSEDQPEFRGRTHEHEH